MTLYLDDPAKGWDDWIKRRPVNASIDGDWAPEWEEDDSMKETDDSRPDP